MRKHPSGPITTKSIKEISAMTVQEFTTEELATEEWRDVVGYEGVYSVSSLGRVRRDLGGYTNAKAGRVLKPGTDRNGYLTVVLCRFGVTLDRKVHLLVATSFIGPRPQGYVINHKDGVKLTNRPFNLEYCTNEENMRHAAEHGLMSSGKRHGDFTRPNTPRGERNHKAKLTVSKVLEIRFKHANGQSKHSLAREYKVSRPNITSIIRRETWAHI